jgi:hypothetical protein
MVERVFEDNGAVAAAVADKPFDSQTARFLRGEPASYPPLFAPRVPGAHVNMLVARRGQCAVCAFYPTSSRGKRQKKKEDKRYGAETEKNESFAGGA